MVMEQHRRLRAWTVTTLCAAVAAGAVLTGALALPAAGWRTVLPMVVAVTVTCAVLGRWPASRTRLAPAAVLVAATSAVGTAAGLHPRSLLHAGLMALVEYGVLLLLVFLVVRFAEPRWAVVAAGCLALSESAIMLRLEPPSDPFEVLGQLSLFVLAAAMAAAVGGYLRSLDSRRLRSVHEARKAQRLQLAADLHDFVAHDVSGIVVLAQAAQVVGGAGQEQVLPLLRRIEAAGLQALASLDRTVLMLGEVPGGPVASGAEAGEVRSGPYGLGDVTDMVDRFRTSGRSEVVLESLLTEEHLTEVPREVAATAHRTVAEGLTNVRRHAGSASSVRITLRVEGNPPDRTLVVGVTDHTGANRAGADHVGADRAGTDAAAAAADGTGSVGGGFGRARRGGGTGLAGLGERVGALGGTLTAGPHGEDGWQLLASFPYTSG
ncbi:sensor histidine kinase [Streptomyces sp. NPDC057939]|uniref:sensor histidine kinase n=1 Tax=Streptomyces sp. NPDC057939 TaxID=3346284 RepID=UPI0036EEEA16